MLHSNSVQCTQVLSKDHLKQSIIFSEAQQILKRKGNANTAPFHTLHLFTTGHTKFGKVGFGLFFSKYVNLWDVICIFTLMKTEKKMPPKAFLAQEQGKQSVQLAAPVSQVLLSLQCLDSRSTSLQIDRGTTKGQEKNDTVEAHGYRFNLNAGSCHFNQIFDLR